MAITNRTVTLAGASAVVHSVQFTRKMVDVAGVQTEKIEATAYGSAVASDGSKTSDMVTWILAAAAENTVRNFLDNQAALALRTKMGLEA